MKFGFECECGERVSDATRGRDASTTTHTRCPGCGTFFAVTISAIDWKRG